MNKDLVEIVYLILTANVPYSLTLGAREKSPGIINVFQDFVIRTKYAPLIYKVFTLLEGDINE